MQKNVRRTAGMLVAALMAAGPGGVPAQGVVPAGAATVASSATRASLGGASDPAITAAVTMASPAGAAADPDMPRQPVERPPVSGATEAAMSRQPMGRPQVTGAAEAATPRQPMERPRVPDARHQKPAAGDAAPVRIDIARAPAPLYDDPIWHGASDPVVVWMPGKGDSGAGEWWLYYTQRRATLPDPRGVEWVHGSAIGIARSPDGLAWEYIGAVQGDMPADADARVRSLGDPLGTTSTWWAPTIFWEGGSGMAGGGLPGDRLHMLVTLVHGIFSSWTGTRTIEHFTSDDGVNWTWVGTLPLASARAIDPAVHRIGDAWYVWYKNEAAGSHTFMARSPDLRTWTDMGEVIGGRGHEAPFVWRWKGSYWMINDAHGQGMDVWQSATGTGDWHLNTNLLNDRAGVRPLDAGVGQHPWIVMQGETGDEQLLLFYFVHDGSRTYIQVAEVTLGADGRLTTDRNRYAPAR